MSRILELAMEIRVKAMVSIVCVWVRDIQMTDAKRFWEKSDTLVCAWPDP
jgi:hypothetical protein